VTGTATYKITDADINAGTVTNAAYTKGTFNNNPISSPLTVALVRYKQPTKKEEHNEEEHSGDRNNYGGPDYGGYGGVVIPMISGSMASSQMFSSEPNGYGSKPNVYASGPSTTEIQNSESNVHKTKVHLSKHKHKHKHHTTKHNKTGKKTLSVKVDKKIVGFRDRVSTSKEWVSCIILSSLRVKFNSVDLQILNVLFIPTL
jgi:hypothetical protein